MAPAFLSTLKPQQTLIKQAASSGLHIVYGYLRAKASRTAAAGTPYYIGIASNGLRPYQQHSRGGKTRRYHDVPVPADLALVRCFGLFGSREEAANREQELISQYGRKGIEEDGILLNRSIGGEQSALGVKRSKRTRALLAEKAKKRDAITHLRKQRQAVAMAKAARLGIPWDCYSAMSLSERARAHDRVKRGEPWNGPTISQEERAARRVEARQRNYAAEIGVDYDLWVSLVKRQRNSITARYRRGIRGAALLEGLL